MCPKTSGYNTDPDVPDDQYSEKIALVLFILGCVYVVFLIFGIIMTWKRKSWRFGLFSIALIILISLNIS